MQCESLFSLMSRVQAIGGPAMGPATTEKRVLHAKNETLASRSNSPSPRTGKPKKWHWTKQHITDGVQKLEAKVSAYPADISAWMSQPRHSMGDVVAASDSVASKAKPELREQYDVAFVANALVVPCLGKVHSS